MRCVKGVGDLLNRQENLENFSYPYVDNRFYFVLNLLLNIRNVSVMSLLLLLTVKHLFSFDATFLRKF